MSVLCGVFFITAVTQTLASVEFFSVPRCWTQAGTAKALKRQPEQGRVHIFHGMTISCSGKLKEWKFHAKEAGSLYLSVWRKDHSDNLMKMVGKNHVIAGNPGIHEVDVDLREQIDVIPEDVLGIHYEHKHDVPVISMQTTSVGNLRPGLISQADLLNDKLTQGTAVPKAGTVRGIASIKATVTGVSSDLRLAGGHNSHSGRAEMRKAGVWGTICDPWFIPQAWAHSVCFELGFPELMRAHSVRKQPGLGILLVDYPIHSTNPRCKLSMSTSIVECLRHSDPNCTHEDDIFIGCASRLKFSKLPDRLKWGIPEMFKGGLWGPICDNRPPSHHLRNPQSSWLTAFCTEMGKGGLKSVQRYNASYVTRSILKNPDCGDIYYPTNMNDCQSGPLETECDGQQYYVKCQHGT